MDLEEEHLASADDVSPFSLLLYFASSIPKSGFATFCSFSSAVSPLFEFGGDFLFETPS